LFLFLARRRCSKGRAAGRDWKGSQASSATTLNASLVNTVVLAMGLACCSAFAFAESAPDDELKFAVVVSRHGVRSPTWTLERLNQYSASPWPNWGVAPGELTAHGRALMTMMGGFYRERFLSQGLLGKAGCASASHVYFRADTDHRTVATAQTLAESLLPGCMIEVHAAGEGKQDRLFGGAGEGAGQQDAALGVAAVTGRLGPRLDALEDAHRPALELLSYVLIGNGKAARSILEEPTALAATKNGAGMTGPLSLASTLSENLLLEYADGMTGLQLGWGRLNESNLLALMTLHTIHSDLMRRTRYLARARGSNLLSYILMSLEQAASGKPVPGAAGSPDTVLLVVVGHDTNLSNLSGMLDLSWLLPTYQADDVPPGSALIFTLWRSPSTDRYSVRLQFVAQTLDQLHAATPLSPDKPPAIANLFVPGCSTAADGYPCGWESFRATAREAIGAEAGGR
jgi:4-phytase / acid phosphatase